MAGGAITASVVVVGEPQHASPPPAEAPPRRQNAFRQHSRATSATDQPTLPLA
jgi:hypothetical protein